MTVVARVTLAPSGATIYDVVYTGNSYSIPGIAVYIGVRSPKLRRVAGCRDPEEAFRVARNLARKANRQARFEYFPDPNKWRLVHVDHDAESPFE